VRSNAERWRSLPTEERQRMRAAWERLRQLPPEQRRAVLDRLLGGDSP